MIEIDATAQEQRATKTGRIKKLIEAGLHAKFCPGRYNCGMIRISVTFKAEFLQLVKRMHIAAKTASIIVKDLLQFK